MNNSVSRVQVCALILLTATAVVAPLIFYGYYPGDDVAFHASLWFETARQWHEGVVYARWASQAIYGYGDPAMVFYPPLSRILGGILVACLPSRIVLVAYGWLALVLGGFNFFSLCREFFDDRSSLVAAFAFVINPYNLFVLYLRCAMAEFLAAALFPLLILAVYRLDRKGKRGVAVLALWVGVFWLTNIPAAIIANYLAALMVLALALIRKSKSLLGRFVAAEALGVGLAAFYLLPARLERFLIDVGAILSWDPLQNFLLVGGWHRRSALWSSVILNVGFLWQVAVGGVAWLYARKFRSERRDAAFALTAVLGVSALMCLPLSAVVWKHAPFLPYVQIPWRWLFALNLAAVFFTAAALTEFERHSWLGLAACFFSLLIILSCFTVRKRVLDWEELATPLRSGAGIAGAADYLPRAAGESLEEYPLPGWLPSPRFAVLDGSGPDRPSLPSEATPGVSANQTTFVVQSWKTESRVFTVDSPQPAWVRVRLFYYPGWHVAVNGNEVKDVERDAHDAIVVRVPSGHSRVQLEFKRTPDETWGIIISCLVAILVAALDFARPAAPDGTSP